MAELAKQQVEDFTKLLGDAIDAMILNQLPQHVLIAQRQHCKTMILMLNRLGYEVKFHVEVKPYMPDTEKPASNESRS